MHIYIQTEVDKWKYRLIDRQIDRDFVLFDDANESVRNALEFRGHNGR